MMALHASQALNKTLPPAPITVYGLAVPAVHTQYEEQERKGSAISAMQRGTPRAKKNGGVDVTTWRVTTLTQI